MKNENILEFDNVSFTYPGADAPAIENISFSVKKSEFVVISGKSGCGKSTLLSHMKKNHIPFGKGEGNMYFIHEDGTKTPIEELDDRISAAYIGFVGQDTEAQIVSDKVWHELSFGLENLGYPNAVMKRRTAEIAEFMGIKELYNKSTSKLSGGEKQLVVLASVMAMNPKLLILDEPINQLSPRAAEAFINALVHINRELSTTVVICEQRLADVIPYADRVLVMEQGRILGISEPAHLTDIFTEYKQKNSEEISIYNAIPAASRVFLKVDKSTEEPMPVSVREGRQWLIKYLASEKPECEQKQLAHSFNKKTDLKKEKSVVIKDVTFSYDKSDKKTLDKLSVSVDKGSFLAIMGGNGSGKTTLMKCMAGILKAGSGKVKTFGKTAYLPQESKALFTEITVEDELAEVFDNFCGKKKISDKEIVLRVDEMLKLLDIEMCRKMHPYDLSGGQSQRLGLGKILLTEPDILLLDEPTKGLDAAFKDKFAQLLKRLQNEGKTIIVITHDMEFAAEYATHCAFMFNGDIVASDEKYTYFADNLFFTTEVSRITKGYINGCITVDDVVRKLTQSKSICN
ncbi:MAG: ATP-binding cassette domain-containing protein [Lachnospiraceae bacterium]|nr:ATP-binding cassette domain-containing protein [Lachnospiraceae bacterium]